jgi:hypothetical protein
MADFPNRLAEACLQALQRGHAAKHSDPFPVQPVSAVITQLATQADLGKGQASLSETTTRGRLAELLAGQQVNKPDNWADDLINRFQLFVPGDEGWRPSRRQDLANPAAYSGAEWLAAGAPERIRQVLAHNYLLRYSEVLPLLLDFRPPGRERSVLDRHVGTFVTVRSMNRTNVEYIFDELRDLGLIRPADGKRWVLSPSMPAPAVAYYLAESYFKFSDFDPRLVQRSRDDVETELRTVCALADVDGDWRKELRPDAPALVQLENVGADVRLMPDDVVWLAGCGLVDPASVARLLRKAECRDGLVRLHAWARSALEDLASRTRRSDNVPLRNQEAFLATFDPDAKD